MRKFYALLFFFLLTGSKLLFAAAPTIASFAPSTGAIGSSVVITGTNFSTTTTNNTVLFGSIAATVTAATSTQLTVTVPVGATTQTISVTVSALTATSASSFTAYAAPTITSFSPSSGKIGSSVTVNGTNFNTTAANNIVFFGAVKATVTGATATQLTVTVPAGASFQPISVINTSTSLAAYSAQPFFVTYLGKSTITTADFDPVTTLTETGAGPTQILTSDINGDGLADMIVMNATTKSVTVFYNKGNASGYASIFSATPDYTLSFSTPGIVGIAVGDVDGDGKPDLIVGSPNASNNIFVYSTIANGGYITGTSTASNTLVATFTVNGIALADIDGDGKLDVLAIGGNGTTNDVDVFRNTTVAGSSSSFAAKVSVNNGTNKPFGLAVGDIDGDGKIDIIDCNKIATSGNGAITVIINTSTPGAVSFATATNFSTGSGVTTPLNLLATDLDGDGKADIAVVNNGGSSISLFRSTTTSGSTTASLDTRIDLTENSTPYGIAVGDINGDGKPDLVVGNSISSAYVSIFTNTSSVGALSFAVKVDLTSGTANPQGVAIQDIDGDGRPDILVPNNNGATASSISIFHTYPVTPPVLTTVSPLKGNVGTSVTITGNYFSATAANDVVYFGAVKATVTSASTTQLIVTVPAGASYAPISVLNNETTNRPSTGYSQQFFTTTFTSKNAITDQDIDLQTTISATGTSPGAIFSADLNGDGLPDMVVFNNINAANNISIYIHTSPNSSYTSAYPSTPTYNLSTTLTTVNQWSPIIAGDVDGDGKPDLLVAPYNASNFTYVYLSSTATGGALFGTTPITLTGTSVPRGIAIGDLDGDGKVDIAVTNGTGSTVSLFRNTSSGGVTSFATGVAVSNGASVNAYGIGIADIDGDGKPDIVTSNESTTVGAGTISIIRNVASAGPFSATSGVSFITPTAGANTILPTGISTVTTKPFSLALGDLDGDGKIDIAVTNYSSNTVSVFRNTSSSNTFSFDNATSSNTTTNIANVSYTTGTSPAAVSIADMDGDGKPDLVVSNYGSPTVSVFRNNTTSGATLSSSSFAGKVDYTVG